jgi:hypothetical protein
MIAIYRNCIDNHWSWDFICVSVDLVTFLFMSRSVEFVSYSPLTLTAYNCFVNWKNPPGEELFGIY